MLRLIVCCGNGGVGVNVSRRMRMNVRLLMNMQSGGVEKAMILR